MTAGIATVLEHEIGATGLLAIRLHTSDVTVRAVDGPDVRIHDLSGTLERSVRVERGAGSLALRADRSLGFGIGSVVVGVGRRAPNLEIEVPRRATVVLETASGDVTVAGLTGDQRYRTASGAMVLRDVSGQLIVDAVSGDVEVRSDGPCSVAARTVSGNLDVRGDVFHALRLSSTSGDVRLDGRLDGSTTGSGPFAIESVSGDMVIGVAGSARVEVRSVTGDVRSDVDVTSEGGRGSRTLVVGAGGPTLTVRTVSGDVRLVRPFQGMPGAPATAVATPVATATTTSVAEPPRSSAPPEALEPTVPVVPPEPPGPDDTLARVLGSLERGEIDVTEASRRLADLDASDASRAAGALDGPGSPS